MDVQLMVADKCGLPGDQQGVEVYDVLGVEDRIDSYALQVDDMKYLLNAGQLVCGHHRCHIHCRAHKLEDDHGHYDHSHHDQESCDHVPSSLALYDQCHVSYRHMKEILLNDKLELLQSDELELLQSDKLELLQNDKLVLLQSDKLELLWSDKFELLQSDKLELLQSDKLELLQSDKLELL